MCNFATPTNLSCRSRDDLPGLPGYSKRGRARELANVTSYLKAQLKVFKPQAEASSRTAFDYGYSNGLGLIDGLPIAGSVTGAGLSNDGGASGSSSSVVGIGGSVEAARTAAQQKVMELEVQIRATEKAGSESIYFASHLGS